MSSEKSLPPWPNVVQSAPQNLANLCCPSVESDTLLGARGELKIAHNGEVYNLRRTRLGKLILTK